MPKTVAISAGHQPGVDNGAASNGLLEANLTIQIADKVVDILRKHGVPVLYVPNNIDLISTINWINQRANQIDGCAVDIHINSGGGSGVEGWNYAGGPNESDKLSQFLADACAAETGLPNRGVKDETVNRHGKLGFIHDTIPTAALIECGFIDTDADRKVLNNPEGIFKMAKGVARGVLGYIGVAWKPELLGPVAPTPPTPTPPTTDYKKLYEDEKKKNLQLGTQITQLSENITNLNQRIKNIHDLSA